MLAVIYVHASKESNYETGQALGLKEPALGNFCYAAYEVRLTLDVDETTGSAKIIAVDGREVAA